MNISRLANVLKGQRVVCIGRSETLITHPIPNQGAFIDSFDVVVRLNRALPTVVEPMDDPIYSLDDGFIPNKFHSQLGKRTTIYQADSGHVKSNFSTYDIIKHFRDQGGKCFVFSEFHYGVLVERCHYVAEQTLVPCFTFYDGGGVIKEICDRYNKLAFQGVIAIDVLTGFDIDELVLLGHTYNASEIPEPTQKTDPALDTQWLIQKQNNDTRIKILTSAPSVLENDFYNGMDITLM